MRWFQLDTDTPNDPRMRAVLRGMGNEGFGGLVRLWCHIANHGGGKKPGYAVDSLGRPMTREELMDASGLTSAQLDQLIAICVESGHFQKRAWDERQVIVLPAMARRADTYTKRRVRTSVARASKNVPVQDSTTQDSTQNDQERGRRRPPAHRPITHVRVITRLVRELRTQHPHADFADLKDLAKAACAQHQIAYDAEAIGRAVESALSKRVNGHAH